MSIWRIRGDSPCGSTSAKRKRCVDRQIILSTKKQKDTLKQQEVEKNEEERRLVFWKTANIGDSDGAGSIRSPNGIYNG
jgi:hypothetical protein